MLVKWASSDWLIGSHTQNREEFQAAGLLHEWKYKYFKWNIDICL